MNETDHLRVACPSCGKNLRVKAALAGKRLKCPSCSKSFDVKPGGEGKAQEGLPRPRSIPWGLIGFGTAAVVLLGVLIVLWVGARSEARDLKDQLEAAEAKLQQATASAGDLRKQLAGARTDSGGAKPPDSTPAAPRADDPKPDPPTTPPRPVGSKPDPDLQGTWKLSLVYDKQDETGKSYLAVSSKYLMTIEGNKMTVEGESDGKPMTKSFTLEVDQGKEPKVYTQTADDKKGGSQSGIYAVRDGKLQMCSQGDGKPPDSFTVRRDDGKDRRILEFERVKR